MKNLIISATNKFLSFYSKYLIAFGVIFLVCFVTGIMVCSRYTSIISVENFIDKYMLSFLRCDSSTIGFFLIHLAFFIGICVLVILLTRNIFFVVIDFIAFALISYVFGFDLCIFIITLGFSGVVIGVIVYGVLGIVVMALLSCIMSVAIRRIFEKKHLCETFDKTGYAKLFCLLIVLSAVVLLCFSVLLSTIHIFVIVD